jgi:hypothetical protein
MRVPFKPGDELGAYTHEQLIMDAAMISAGVSELSSWALDDSHVSGGVFRNGASAP